MERRKGPTVGTICALAFVAAALLSVIIALAIILGGTPESSTTTDNSTNTTTVVAPATVLAAPSATTPNASPLDLGFLCNMHLDDGTCAAVVSYTLDSRDYLVVPSGVHNIIDVAGAEPLETFSPGYHFGGAQFTWDCTTNPLTTWRIQVGDSAPISVTVPADHIECPRLPI